MQIINAAKKRQEAEANKNASILLEELDYEKKKEERRKAQAQKKRDKKKQKKKKKTSEKQSVDTEEDGEKEEEDEEQATGGFPFINADQRTPMMINGTYQCRSDIAYIVIYVLRRYQFCGDISYSNYWWGLIIRYGIFFIFLIFLLRYYFRRTTRPFNCWIETEISSSTAE